jgi:GDP-mannose transporter
MVTVLKNLTNFLVIWGDLAFFGKRYSTGVWATLLLMLASAAASAATDLAFDARGYGWQLANNAFTASYSLLLRHVMTQTAALQQQQQQQQQQQARPGAGAGGGGGSSSGSRPAGGTDELAMVVYNNLLSIPMILGLVFATGEAGRLAAEPALWQRGFQLAALSSALISFLISVASMWFLSCTTATTFSLVGSLNKIPLALLGMALFKAPTSANNVASVMIGLAAGVVFAHAKSSSSGSGGGSSSWGSRAGGSKAGGGREGSPSVGWSGRAGPARHASGTLPRHTAAAAAAGGGGGGGAGHHSIHMQQQQQQARHDAGSSSNGLRAEQQPLLRH